jgi:outer membrane protein TolC
MDGQGRRRRWGKPRSWWRRALCHGLALGIGLGPAGCTRSFFRQKADSEVAVTLAEKDKYPAWKIDQFHVYPDPCARFADPTNPDRPPMPPDDPASYDLSPHPQRPGKAGVERVEGAGYLELMAQWDTENRAEAASSTGSTPAAGQAGQSSQVGTPPAPAVGQPGPEGRPPVPRTEQPDTSALAKPTEQKPGGAAEPVSATTSLSTKTKPGERPPYLLKLEQAVQLGLINSREYQDAREDLYMTALPVTLERFSFAAQFFAAGQVIREWAGVQSPEGHQNNWTANSNFGFTKLFSTGALLLVNFANQTVFNLTGTGRGTVSQSTINLDLIQPFLRGGGRAVTLEPLTQAERNLVYAIRNFARFREEFYVAIAGGGGGSITGASFQPTGVIAAPTFSPVAGLGSSGLIPGVPAAVPVTGNPGAAVNPGEAGRLALITALAAPVSGYLTTLLQAAQMRVDEYNIEKLQGYLELARAMEEGGDISRLQVDQFEQQVLLRRTSLLTDQLQYLQSLDQFKLQLGLPTALPIELDDSPFRPLNRMFQRYEDLFRQFEAASREPLRFGTLDQVARVRAELLRLLTTAPIVQGTPFRTKIEPSWRAWEQLSADQLQQRLTRFRDERRRLLGEKADLESQGKNLSAAGERRLLELEFEIDLGEFESVLRDYESQPWKNVADADARRRQQQARFRYVVNAFILVMAEARNERVEQLRTQWPDLARLCVNGVDLLKADLDEAQAVVVQSALTNRFDLMNVRANLVDAWRQLAVFANALLGTFNVQYHMDTSTPAGLAQPLNFSGSRTHQELFFDWQLPLVRIAERNNYRASLINYQRARRILERAEDQVAFDVRGEIRQLRQQEEVYRIQQRQVELAYLTVENSLDTFQAPPAPLAAGQPAADTATRAAALTTQLINAQTSLYNAQFQMTTIWITYLNTRLDLYRDMELMPLDQRGVWIDDVAKCQCPDGDAARPAGAGEPGRDASSSGPAGQRDHQSP